MNIQIFGTKKCFDTKKAERWFKERNIKYQYIDMKEKGMSKGEFISVKQALGGIDSMINENAKDKDTLVLMKYLSDQDREDKLLENPQLISDDTLCRKTGLCLLYTFTEDIVLILCYYISKYDCLISPGSIKCCFRL